MYCNSRRIKKLVLVLGTALAPLISIQAQNSVTNGQPTAFVTILDSTKEKDGLIGSVRRVKIQSAKLEAKSERLIEGPLQLLEITTYSLSGNRIENVSYPVATSSVGKEEYKYDDKGNIVEMTLRGDNGSIISKERYEYELDRFGNWTKMVTSLVVFEAGELKYEPVEVTYRTLSYYFDESIAKIVNTGPHPILPPVPAAEGLKASNGTSAEIQPNKLTDRDQYASSVEVAVYEPLKVPKPADTKESISLKGKEGDSGTNRTSVNTGSLAVPPTKAGDLSAESTGAVTGPKNSAPNAPAGKAFDYYKAGRGRFDSGDLKEAVDAFKQSLELEPKAAEVQLSLGLAYLRLKQNRDAIKAFKQATILNPEMAESYYGLGLSSFPLGRNKEAAEAFKRAIALRPDMAKAHYALALVCKELGKHDEVVAEFRVLDTLDRGLAKKLSDTFPEFNLPCFVPPFCK